MSTLGDLMPPDPDAAPPQPARGAPLGDLLAAGGPAPKVGGTIVPSEMDTEEDMKSGKPETLSDLRAKYPALQSAGSNWVLYVERKKPKVHPRTGMKHDGTFGPFCALHDGKDLLTVDGFYEQFGHGTYYVWVEGPSNRGDIDPYTQRPKILRKAEISLDLPERPQVTQQPLYPTYPFPPQPAVNPAVEVRRIEAESRREEILLQEALRNGRGDSQAIVDVLREQIRASENRVAEMTKIIESMRDQRGSVDPLTQSLMERQIQSESSRIEQIRVGYQADLDRMRSSHESEVARMRESHQDRLDRLDRDSKDREERLRRDYEERITRLNDEIRALQSRSQADEREVRRGEQERFDGLLRVERESFRLNLESAKNEFERNMKSAREDYATRLEMLASDRNRDLQTLESQHAIVLQVKDGQISALTSQVESLRREVESLRDKVNVPFEEKVREVATYSRMLGLGASEETPSDSETKEDLMDKAVRVLETPAGPIIANLVSNFVSQKMGIPVPGAPLPPNGNPAPRQVTQQAGQQRQQQRRKQQAPVQQAANNAPAPQPQQQAQQQQAPQPQQQAQQQMPTVTFRGPAPMDNESLKKLLPTIHDSFRSEIFKDPRPEPKAFADSLRAQLSLLTPGQDTASKFTAWIDGRNFCRLLYRVSGGSVDWGSQEEWMAEMWSHLEVVDQPQQDNVSPEAPQGAIVTA